MSIIKSTQVKSTFKFGFVSVYYKRFVFSLKFQFSGRFCRPPLPRVYPDQPCMHRRPHLHQGDDDDDDDDDDDGDDEDNEDDEDDEDDENNEEVDDHWNSKNNRRCR